MRLVLGLVLWALASLPCAQERAVSKQVVVAAPVEAVWRAWTTREGIVGFMAPDAEIDARVGGAFHVFFDPYGEPGLKGADDMRYMALQPPTLLSFDWSAPPHLAQARRQRTFVIVRLKDLGSGATQVNLTQIGWGDGGEWDLTYTYFDRAWGTVLGNLKKRFEQGPIDWSDWLAQLKAMHATAAASAPR